MRKIKLASLAVALLVATAALAAQGEAVAFGVNNFGGTGQCGTSDTDDLSHCDDFVDDFVSRLSAAGVAQVESHMNTAVDGRDWTDYSKMTSFGADDTDPDGADFADITMICSHGKSVHTGGNYYSYFVMGDNNTSETCYPRTDTHILLGNGSNADTEIAILATCQSAQYPVWDGHGYDKVVTSSGTLSSWLGFHGDSIDSSTDANHFDDYLRTSMSDGLGDNWLDRMYRSNVRMDVDGTTVTVDECPVAIFFCEYEGDCDDQHTWGGLQDRYKIANSDPKKMSKYYGIDGCDPYNGNPI